MSPSCTSSVAPSRHRARAHPAHVGVVRPDRRVADNDPVLGDHLDHGQVGEMRAAVIGIVEQEDVVRLRTARAHGAHRLGERAQMHGNVGGLRDHPAVGVEQRARGIAPLPDVRRERAALEHRAHLLGDHRDQRLEKTESASASKRAGACSEARGRVRGRLWGCAEASLAGYRVTSMSHPPIGRARAVQPGATSSVASGRAITAGPCTVASRSPPESTNVPSRPAVSRARLARRNPGSLATWPHARRTSIVVARVKP